MVLFLLCIDFSCILIHGENIEGSIFSISLILTVE